MVKSTQGSELAEWRLGMNRVRDLLRLIRALE